MHLRLPYIRIVVYYKSACIGSPEPTHYLLLATVLPLMPPRSSAARPWLWYRGLSCNSTVRPTLLSRISASHFGWRSSPASSEHIFTRSFSTTYSTFTGKPSAMTQIERITEHLEKPELDDRSYRVIRLPNQLEALLVHDPDTDKASAAVNVNVGNFSDEDDMPGMAHAVEHLLFMGTKKVCRLQD